MFHPNDTNLCDVSLASPLQPPSRSTTGVFNSTGDTLLRLASRSSLSSLPLTPPALKHANDSLTNLSNHPSAIAARVLSRPKSFSTLHSSCPNGDLPQLPTKLKRPSDYFSSKIGSLAEPLSPSESPSSGDVPLFNLKDRPRLDGSLLSSSDELYLVMSNPMDRDGSRVTSWATSLVATCLDSPTSCGGRHGSTEFNNASTYFDETPDKTDSIDPTTRDPQYLPCNNQLENLSDSTIIQHDIDRASSLSAPRGPYFRPSLRAVSTSAMNPGSSVVLRSKSIAAGRQGASYGALPRSTSSMGLFRTKSTQFSFKEAKERLELRKKIYDEYCDDDDIMPNDVENLVFNVPIIKNKNALHRLNLPGRIGGGGSGRDSRKVSPTNSKTILSRRDFVLSDRDTKYAGIHPTSLASIPTKPFPLAGVEHPSIGTIHEQLSDEAEIARNISTIYSQQAQQDFEAMKHERIASTVETLPSFVKTQCATEDMPLVSAEKLRWLDQSRPIHLPPKSDMDKIKHHREISSNIANYQSVVQHHHETLRRLAEKEAAHRKTFTVLIDGMLSDSNHKSFNRKFSYERHSLRKLAWHSGLPLLHRFAFLMKILVCNTNQSEDIASTFANQFDSLLQKFKGLAPAIKANKDAEFCRIISAIVNRPLIKCMMSKAGRGFEAAEFHKDLRFMMYIKSLSGSGLCKHEEMFLIPVLLILFGPTQSHRDIFCMLELINQLLLTPEVLKCLNGALQTWTSVKILHHGLNLRNFMGDEFKGLNSSICFEILLQLDDSLPLSHSAPCTPILDKFFPPIKSQQQQPQQAMLQGTDTQKHENDSCATRLIMRLLLILVVYSNAPKTRTKHIVDVFESMLLVIVRYYHLNWNNYGELLQSNTPIRLNNCLDNLENLASFTGKWWDTFQKVS